jgi:hypothetical protein
MKSRQSSRVRREWRAEESEWVRKTLEGFVGFLARKCFKLDYPTICGLLAGSMADLPALALQLPLRNLISRLVAYAAILSFASAAPRVVFMALTLNWLAQARRSDYRKR